jgi:hypothetical protein
MLRFVTLDEWNSQMGLWITLTKQQGSPVKRTGLGRQRGSFLKKNVNLVISHGDANVVWERRIGDNEAHGIGKG